MQLDSGESRRTVGRRTRIILVLAALLLAALLVALLVLWNASRLEISGVEHGIGRRLAAVVQVTRAERAA
jgi:hypothetical protein